MTWRIECSSTRLLLPCTFILPVADGTVTDRLDPNRSFSAVTRKFPREVKPTDPSRQKASTAFGLVDALLRDFPSNFPMSSPF